MIAGKTVKVNVKDTDRYGKVSTAEIKDVSLEMIKASMAWHYSYYDNILSYKLAQQQAKKEKKVWGESV